MADVSVIVPASFRRNHNPVYGVTWMLQSHPIDAEPLIAATVARTMKHARCLEIVAAASALWLVAAVVVIGERIEDQVEATRAIEAELADGDGASAQVSPSFLDIACVMFRYGGWQLAEFGGAPMLTLVVAGAASMGARRRGAAKLRARTRFPSSAERI
jgi:hypothetical protein